MPKLANETDLQYKRRVIDIKSESFCAAKWYNATIWLGSGQTTSCHHPLPHQVSVAEVEVNPKALHNTRQKKSERALMQDGVRPAGCEYCWKIEDMYKDPKYAGKDVPVPISDRVYKTVIYEDGDLDEAFNTRPEQDVNLQTLEIAFDRTCQFACSYCNPAFSSTWVKDIRRNGGYTNLVSDGRNHFTHEHDSSQLYTITDVNPYVEAFFKWWESDLHKTLKELRITGGEPLMSGYTWRLIDWFQTNKGASKTRLAINSNLGFEQDKLERLLDATEGIELDLYTSNESIGRHAVYIRDGLDWNQWCDNVTYLLDSGRLRGLHVMCTINALCLLSLAEFLWMIVKLKQKYGKDSINFSLNILRFPSFQSPLILPENIRQQAREELVRFVNANNKDMIHEFEFNQVTRLVNYLMEVDSPHSGALSKEILQRDFKNFYEQYDQRRGKNFKETFPQLAEWYDAL
jgi:pyruvate-formate lyase-activating enzyme